MKLFEKFLKKYEQAKVVPASKDVEFTEHISVPDVDTEKSYDSLLTQSQLLELFVFLYTKTAMLFAATFSNIILFTMQIHMAVFTNNHISQTADLVICIFTFPIIAVDIISSLMHNICTKIAATKPIKPRNIYMIVIDLIFQIALAVLHIGALLNSIEINYHIMFCINLIRLYRVCLCLDVISATPRKNYILFNIITYGMSMYVITLMCCAMFKIVYMDFGDVSILKWIEELEGNNVSEMQVFFYSFLASLTTFNNIGILSGVEPSNYDYVLMTALMVVGSMMVQGIFLGSSMAIRKESHRNKAYFYEYFKMIKENLEDPRVPRNIRNNINRFYRVFWVQERATSRSKLFEQFPMSIRQRILLDKYWAALQKTGIFTNANPGFLRDLSTVMTTHIFATGELLFADNEHRNMMMYITKGNIQLLSMADNESPLLTLGVGTCIGSACLKFHHVNKIQVQASSYCVIHCLTKCNLWRVAAKYRKLYQGELINKHFEEKITTIRAAQRPSSGMSFFSEISRKDKSDFYVVTEYTNIIHDDQVFYQTKFPWIFQPNSNFILVWNVTIVVICAIISVLLPVWLVFFEKDPLFVQIYFFSNVVFVLDLALQICTVVEDENKIYTTLSTICKSRISTVTFWLDVCAAIPIYYFSILLIRSSWYDNTYVQFVATAMRLLKTHKICWFFSMIENTFKFNIALLRLVKYVFYIIMAAFWLGTLYFITACNPTCSDNSWVGQLEEKVGIMHRYQIFYNSFEISFLVIISEGGGVIHYKSVGDMLMLVIMVVTGILMFNYIAADYGATLTLMNAAKVKYMETVITIAKLYDLEIYNANDKINLKRIYSYLSFQWRFNKGQTMQSLLFEAPNVLYEAQQKAKFSDVFERITLFSQYGKKISELLATKCNEVYFAPNEIFIYANEPCLDMYVIEKGYCEFIPGSDKVLKRVEGPGAVIGLFEILLGLNSVYFVRPITSIELVKISRKNIQTVLRDFPELKRDIDKCKDSLNITENITFQFAQYTTATDVYSALSPSINVKMPSFFKFPSEKISPLHMDYIHGWGNYLFMKCLMVPITIMPEGLFLIVLEIIHTTVAILVINISLTADIWTTEDDAHKIEYFLYAMQIMQYFVIYLRFHVCFYNDDGILVTHPRETAKNYFKGAFITDMVAVFPVHMLLRIISLYNNVTLRSIYGVNTIVQMYRLPSTFYYATRDELAPPKIYLKILRYLPIMIVFMNLVIAVLSFSIMKIHDSESGKLSLVYDNATCMGTIVQLFGATDEQKRNSGYMYMLMLHYVLVLCMQLGNTGIMGFTWYEMVICTIMRLGGFLLFTYILVTLTNALTEINVQLTRHQSNMRQLIKFMKREELPKHVQRRANDYFECMWLRNRGLTQQQIIGRCHGVLAADFMYYQFKHTFTKVAIFSNTKRHAYRNLSLALERFFVLSDTQFVMVNDVISKLYIVHSGIVEVIDAAGKVVTQLGRGALVGNLDNVSHVRTMVSYQSLGTVELLQLETKTFYTIVSESTAKKLQLHLQRNYLTYYRGKYPIRESLQIAGDERLTCVHVFLLSTMYSLIVAMCSYLSVWCVTYVIAFHETSHTYAYIYPWDFIHAIFLILKFFTPYQEPGGQWAITLEQIRKKIVRTAFFYVNLIGLIPLELFTLLEPNPNIQLTVWQVLLLLRCLRVYNIVKVYRRYSALVNVDVLVTQIATFYLGLLLVIHLMTCVICVIAQNVKSKVLMLDLDSNVLWQDMCGKRYLCSFHHAASILTATGYVFYPRHIAVIVTYVLLFFVSRFFMSVWIAKLSATIQSYSVDLAHYNHYLKRLNFYIRRSYISRYLFSILVQYCDQLWHMSRGVQEPTLLTTAPSYMKQDIRSNFAKHLFNNLIFSHCHMDFLRHLLKSLNVEIFFRGDYICQQGDINETIYFIHRGFVDVYYVTDHEIVLVDQMQELDSFGMVQGLFPRTPHTHTFKCSAVTVVLTLKLQDWFYLLKFYPASKFYIYDSIGNL